MTLERPNLVKLMELFFYNSMKFIVWLRVYCAFDEAFEWHFPQWSGQCDCEHFSPSGVSRSGEGQPSRSH